MKIPLLILDFGSQYTQLIARRVREQKVYCEILPCTVSAEEIKKLSPDALIFSGGPSSVNEKEAPVVDPEILESAVPILGICYGMQWLSHVLGGTVKASGIREYGKAWIHLEKEHPLFEGFSEKKLQVWMSHGDSVEKLPEGYAVLARSENGLLAAMGDSKKQRYGLQFHPEVSHTPLGSRILSNFLFTLCHLKPDWSISSFVETKIGEIREQVGTQRVVCAVSGGVDSSVMAALLYKAIGNQLHAFFIDNGLLRKDEGNKVIRMFQEHGPIPVEKVDSSTRFLKALAGVTDPEKKRKIIGHEFVAVFEEQARSFEGASFLAQGTLYPDVIESLSFKGPSATIKTHHNVGGLPEKMGFKLIEPFRELFKDEVRELGRLLKLPETLIQRQPFPGPGLAVRILGEITTERLDILREADDIIVSEIKKAGLYQEIWQAFGVLLPIKTVGVMGDARTYEHVLAIRAVQSLDGMTADWVHLPYELLGLLSNRIINEVRGINRVVYDVSSKPPATIEWE